MDDRTRNLLASALRHQMRHFLWDERARKAARGRMIRQILEFGWEACVFGGTIRDLVVRGAWAPMRDIDIVVSGVTTDELEMALSQYVVRRTRFGGLNLCVEGWYFDVWPLQETWAFKAFHLTGSSFEDLPKTTFLTIESIAVELNSKTGVPRRIFEHQFFESIVNRVVELNLEDNPYPALGIVRALAVTRRLDFRIGPRLAKFLVTQFTRLSIDEIQHAQLEHYRQLVLSADEISRYVRLIERALDRSDTDPVELPFPRQLPFPWMAVEPAEVLFAEVADATDSDVVSV